MPAVKLSIIYPTFEQFAELLPDRTQTTRPLGFHSPGIPGRVVFGKLVQVLVFSCAYDKVIDDSCSATTLRRRRDGWIASETMERLQEIVLDAYDWMIGLELSDVVVGRCIIKVPCGGKKTGRSPVDRGK